MTALVLMSGKQFKSVDELLNFADELEETNLQLRHEQGLSADHEIAARLRARWSLTGKESAVVRHLYARGGMVSTKPQIMHAVYGLHADDEPEIKIVDVFVCKIRKKLTEDAIVTEWGHGYRMSGAFMADVKELLAQPLPDVERAPTAPIVRPKRITMQAKALAILSKQGDLTISELAGHFAEKTTYSQALSIMDQLKRAGRAHAVSEKRGRTGAVCKVYRMTPVGERYLLQNSAAL